MWGFRLAHNELLQHLADGGIIYSLSFVWLILLSISKRIENNKSNNYLVAGICSFIVVFTTETFSQNTYFFMLLFLLLLNSFKKVEHS